MTHANKLSTGTTAPTTQTGRTPAPLSRQDLANCIRVLAMDAVQHAKSGHPGMPMGMADIAEVLFTDYLRFNPANPGWVDRDRFVVSNGHGCMLQYALLHLTGYDLPLQELKRFRQLHSRTPGHPEYGLTPGVETTTGPLGQGLANAVGMALAEAKLAAEFNRDGLPLIDHCTYCFAGDGCLMEGISHEACSLAGHLQLGKLIVLYDDNGISIDGEVSGWFTDDTANRFEAYGWQVVRDVDGHDAGAIKAAIDSARTDVERPTLICCKTVIGFGAPSKQGTGEVHGAPLGEDEVILARRTLGWDDDTPFAIPQALYDAWDKRAAGVRLEREWNAVYAEYADRYPELAADFDRRMAGDLPADWSPLAEAYVRSTATNGVDTATRKASKAALGAYAKRLPELVGGSADLSGSNGTAWDRHCPMHGGNFEGNYIHYGVREFGMTAIANGLSLHGGIIPFVGTFLTFSDYARNAVRLAALMRIRNILVYTHDSIGLGEDGPTHQPIEHLASLRLIPNLHVWRPADDVETAVAWAAALERRDGPTALSLTRQTVAHQHRDDKQAAAIRRGGYVLHEPDRAPEALVLATGSEVTPAMAAARTLAEEGRAVRVVSMPCVEAFLAQEAKYRNRVLPPEIEVRLVVEAGVSHYWRALAGARGAVLGVDTFGESAPGDDVFAHFGLDEEGVTRALRQLLGDASVSV